MLKFMLRPKPVVRNIEGMACECWQVVQINMEPSKVVAEFVGSDSEKTLSREIAPAVAGDYVEFLNEKYLDKEINAEWPPMNKMLYLKYHLERASELAKEVKWQE